MSKKNLVISIQNPQTSEGKSSLAWVLLAEYAVRFRDAKESPVLLNADLVNADLGDPTISDFVNPNVFTGFDVMSVDDASPDVFKRKIVMIDGSRTPDKDVTDLIAARSNIVIIPIRSTRGYKKGIEYARALFAQGVKFCFVLNGFEGDKAKAFSAILDAFDTKVFDLGGALKGVQDITQNGLTQYMSNDWHVLAYSVSALAQDIFEFAGFEFPDSVVQKPKLGVVANG